MWFRVGGYMGGRVLYSISSEVWNMYSMERAELVGGFNPMLNQGSIQQLVNSELSTQPLPLF